MAWGDGVKQLTSELKKLHEEFVTTRVQFAELKERVITTITEFKVVIEKTSEKMDIIEKEHIRERAELKAEISSLSKRLDSLSEGALHVAMRDVAEKLTTKSIKDEKNINMIEGKKLDDDSASDSKSA